MLRNIIAGAAVASALATSAFAAGNTAQDTATVDAKIVQPITVTKKTNMNFGTIIRPDTGNSTVTLSPTGTPSVTGSATVFGGTPSAASFDVKGEGASLFTVTAANFNITSGASTLAVTPNVVAAAGTLGTLPGTLGTQATQTLNVGASFPITNTTPTGAYTGTLTLLVNYQ